MLTKKVCLTINASESMINNFRKPPSAAFMDCNARNAFVHLTEKKENMENILSRLIPVISSVLHMSSLIKILTKNK